ncbi:glycosyltransferase family 4 protein [Facklamia sp. DSM 111018]|uniref:Glycosyltransferase family 4 protein n=1 Tax=Facklamia lactis TaxID=2749967 RepID=A0ABS0LQ18_9LACT|nr:glycosyltransferase family 4 protein [Facklamia lactis]MBG9980254.1 glycosyltransferase family 4 protein [Facklamia lactis]MBG9986057.1 glycosyltransferase family 4 protein [Facklamia lactis]
MKILHIIAQLPGQTGSGIYYQNLINGLASYGIDNALIYAEQKENPVSFINFPTYPVHFMTEKLPFPIVGMSDSMPYSSSKYSELTYHQISTWHNAFTQQLIRAKNEFQPDIVISHHLWFLTSLTLDIFDNCPVVGVSHGTDIRQAKHSPILKNSYVQELERLAMVFALSHQDKRTVQTVFNIPAEKIHVTGNGYNPYVFNRKENSASHHKNIKILYAGKITESKGVFELAKAYLNLKKKYPEIELSIVGNGNRTSTNYLVQLLKGLDTNDYQLLNAISQVKLAELMKNSDLFVLPSYYEGLATIALEALACGLRVVSTNLLPLKDLLGDAINESGIIEYVDLPRIVNLDQPVKNDLPKFQSDLEKAISIQIDRIKKEDKLSASIYEDIAQFSWPKIIQKQYSLLVSLKQD